MDSISFSFSGTFPSVHSGSYYLEIKHRNSISVWSSYPCSYTKGSPFLYDYTSNNTSAYGNNLINIEDKYCLYSGDAIYDGLIEGLDLAKIDDDAANFVEGYVQSDLTGDGFVDVSDLVIVTEHAPNFVAIAKP